MEELRSSSDFSQKEKTILMVVGIILLIVFVFSVLKLYKKFKPNQQDRKVSITNIIEEKNKNQTEQLIGENKTESAENQSQDQSQDKNISPSEIDIKVLNGGATAGTALKIKNSLISEGYSKTESGNAKLSNYQGVTVYYKTDFKNQVDDLKQILGEQYKIITTKEGANNKEVDGDIVVIMGK
jgi:hypothetical protein